MPIVFSNRCGVQYIPHITRRQGKTEWAVLIDYFQLCTRTNHTRKWLTVKAVDPVTAHFHYRALSSFGIEWR